MVAGRNDDELDSVEVEAVDGGREMGRGGGGRLAVVAIGTDTILDPLTVEGIAGVD